MAKTSALSYKDPLDKYEYLTGEDLGHKPSVFEKARFEYSPLGMPLSKAFKKNEVKSVAKSISDFNHDSKHAFYRFYKRHNEFEEMSLDSKYNRMKEINKLLINFKAINTQKEKQLKKEQIMRNVDKSYEKYYNAYSSYCDADGELNEAKRKSLTTNSLNWLIKQVRSQNLMKKQKILLRRLKKKVLIKRDLVDILTINLVY